MGRLRKRASSRAELRLARNFAFIHDYPDWLPIKLRYMCGICVRTVLTNADIFTVMGYNPWNPYKTKYRLALTSTRSGISWSFLIWWICELTKNVSYKSLADYIPWLWRYQDL
jgi:hypothetical protein